MFRSYRIGTLFGFPIEVNLSFLILLGAVLLLWGGLVGVIGVLIIATSVLLHELGHAAVARHLGVAIAGIELHFFGGVAKMVSQPRRANDEVLIAAAGPAVSFALAGVGFLLQYLTGSWVLSGFFHYFGLINLILGGFNLVPALPMDGGRILRAVLTRKYDYLRATEISIKIARGFAILLGVYGLATMQLFLPLLAVVLWFMGSAEMRVAHMVAGEMSYDASGYRHRGYPEVLPRDYWRVPSTGAGPMPYAGGDPSHPFFRVHRPVASGGFVIRQRNGRWVIDIIR